MSLAKLAVLGGVAALALSGCGTSAPPLAGTIPPNGKSKGRFRVDDPRTNHPNHVACMRKDHLPVTEVGQTGLQIGPAPGGPTVVFEPTSGVAQGNVMQGIRSAQGAEVIGSALLYPNQGSASELSKIETCLAQGVNG